MKYCAIYTVTEKGRVPGALIEATARWDAAWTLMVGRPIAVETSPPREALVRCKILNLTENPGRSEVI